MSKPLLLLVLGVAALAYWAWRKSQVPEQGKLTQLAEQTADRVGAAAVNVVTHIPGFGGGSNVSFSDAIFGERR